MGLADANLLESGHSILIVVDVQPKFLPVMLEAERMVENVRRLVACARICNVPVLATTQYAEKLGQIEPSVAELMPDTVVIDKMTFSCLGNDQFRRQLSSHPTRTQAILCGLETHVCVSQTAHNLLDEGYIVHLAGDAITSRTEFNWKYGLERLRHVGATVSSAESIIFEWLRVAGTPEFKEASSWIK